MPHPFRYAAKAAPQDDEPVLNPADSRPPVFPGSVPPPPAAQHVASHLLAPFIPC